MDSLIEKTFSTIHSREIIKYLGNSDCNKSLEKIQTRLQIIQRNIFECKNEEEKKVLRRRLSEMSGMKGLIMDQMLIQNIV